MERQEESNNPFINILPQEERNSIRGIRCYFLWYTVPGFPGCSASCLQKSCVTPASTGKMFVANTCSPPVLVLEHHAAASTASLQLALTRGTGSAWSPADRNDCGSYVKPFQMSVIDLGLILLCLFPLLCFLPEEQFTYEPHKGDKLLFRGAVTAGEEKVKWSAQLTGKNFFWEQ